MDLVVELTRERGMSTILITHDLGLAAAYCDRIVVMQKGRWWRRRRDSDLQGATARLYPQADAGDAAARHDAARPAARAIIRRRAGLASALPRPPPPAEPLLVVENLVKEYPREGAGGTRSCSAVRGLTPGDVVPRGRRHQLHDRPRRERRAGRRIRLRQVDHVDDGHAPARRDFGPHPVRRRGHRRDSGQGVRGNADARRIQMVFQDPTDSLNPRFTAARAIADPILRLGGSHGGKRRRRARALEELARLVGLPVDLLDRFPHQLSGGQKARVGIARAIALEPELVILDEPTAALDVSVQAVVLNLLEDLISSDRVIVMKAGRIVEQGATETVLGMSYLFVIARSRTWCGCCATG
jgi:peptide/nickel transport system ATP-binding protein